MIDIEQGLDLVLSEQLLGLEIRFRDEALNELRRMGKIGCIFYSSRFIDRMKSQLWREFTSRN